MKKILNFIGILLVATWSMAFAALFYYIGWSLLINILQFGFLPSISYIEWFAILCFCKLLPIPRGTTKTIQLSELFTDPEYISARATSIFNKVFAIFILYIISLFV